VRDYANPQLLISPESLSARIGTPGLHVLDCRPTEAYVVGHLPGAVHADLYGLNLCDSDPGPLHAFLWMIGYLFGIKGIDQRQTVVLYDDTTDWRVARTWWLLDYFGHDDARVLNGGFQAWVRADLPLSRDPVTPVRTVFVPRPHHERLATYSDVLAVLGKPETRLIDTRNRLEYLGQDVQAARGGAIPGAIWIDYLQNLTERGAFKPAGELEATYRDAGIGPEKEVITYCQGGYRGAHAYLALRLLGYPRVRNYIGAWKEWGDRLELPIERPNIMR
jgi:thiosulfate/3-mercaptopyruvate sulfurtransferase